MKCSIKRDNATTKTYHKKLQMPLYDMTYNNIDTKTFHGLNSNDNIHPIVWSKLLTEKTQQVMIMRIQDIISFQRNSVKLLFNEVF